MTERKLDSIGRIIIPINIFRNLNFSKWQDVEITIEYGKICIKSYEDKDVEKRPYVGVVRCIDHLRRVTIPREYLKTLNMDIKTYYEVSEEGEKVVISKKWI